MNVTKEQIQEIKELVAKVLNLYEDKVKLDLLKIDRENTLKDEIASACEIRNKQGELQPNKVKMPLVSALIDEMFLEKNNKKEAEYVLMETYRSAISSKRVNNEALSAYVAIRENLEENAQNIKEAFKESSTLDRAILEAINYLTRTKYKELLENKKQEAGIETKPPKDMTAVMELIKELEKMLSK